MSGDLGRIYDKEERIKYMKIDGKSSDKTTRYISILKMSNKQRHAMHPKYDQSGPWRVPPGFFSIWPSEKSIQ